MIHRAAVIRLYPHKAQQIAMYRWQGALRFVWNHALGWCKQHREYVGKWPNQRAIQARIVAMKSENDWLKDVPAHALIAVAEDLARAMKNWFEKRANMPRYRGRYGRAFSIYMVNQTTTFQGAKVKLPKLGVMRFRGGTLPEGRLLSSRVWQEAGKWFMSSVFECKAPQPSEASASVGIDMGVKTLATIFDGSTTQTVANPKALKRTLRKLKRLQRIMSRRKKGSRRREKAKMKVARLHQRVANIRKDVQHKATTSIVAHAALIKVETLNIKGMARGRNMGQSVGDAGMSGFLSKLKYKAAWHGRELIEIDRWFASSQICSQCGTLHKEMAAKRLDVLSCECGNVMQRDDNAARNIYWYGEERQNHCGMTQKTLVETGVSEPGSPGSVLVNESRMFVGDLKE